MTTARDRKAVADLMRVIRNRAEQQDPIQLILTALANSVIAQAQTQVIFQQLIAKGFITAEQLEREISVYVESAAEQMDKTKLVMTGVPTKLVLS
jgi:hypothetical protein